MEKNLIKYLNKLKEQAVSSHPTKTLKKRFSIYSKGSLNTSYNQGVATAEKTISTNNILKSIVDTVCTFALDQHITKEVVLRSMSFSDMQNLESLNNKASVLNDCLQDVVDQNHDKGR